MAARIPVLLEENPYEVIVGDGILPRVGEFVRQKLPATRCALVTDSNVAPLYAAPVREALEEAGIAVTEIIVPAGEASKSLAQAGEVCDRMIEGGLDRGAFVAALGGGVVGDLAGFAAAIYFRGIPHVQIPTTIVAQVDSAIGGKTGVNARGGKNLLGCFLQPSLVVTDPAVLGTLPRREFNEGFAEVIKHAVIHDATMLDDLEEFPEIDLPSLVARNVKIKALIVADDEFETRGVRALLNFGHTIGHAIEKAGGYGKFLHGEAVSLGIVAALRISEKRAGLSAEETARVLSLLQKMALPVSLDGGVPTEALLEALRRDKKFENGAIRFVLTKRLGTAFVSKDVTENDVREAVEGLRETA